MGAPLACQKCGGTLVRKTLSNHPPKQFPTLCDLLGVAKSLGYRKA